ncbi:hypothetical protein PsexTeo8_64080 (plasmid) [Pseudomonas extremaustralis]|nr:hypothetical protein [Pseudomonas extremaustralis]
MTDAITIQNPRNRGGSTGHVLAKRSVTFTEIRSSGGKQRLGSITKAGDAYLRSLLVLGARSVMANLGDKQDTFSRWIRNLIERRGYWRAAVAIAAKNARMAWAVLHYGDTFKLEQVEPTGA